MIIVAIICFGLYAAFIFVLLIGLQSKPRRQDDLQRSITVVIPVRNEEENILDLLQDLNRQHYRNFDVIVVDDHSEDDTRSRIQGMSDPRVTLITNQGVGKKSAITTGVAVATGEIIATTDGDCRVHEDWVTSVNDCFNLSQTDMAIGSVVVDETNNLFSKMQQLEFASLVGTAVSTLEIRFPMMCNGANLAYRKIAFGRAGGYNDNLHIPSGDDEFLMRKIFAANPRGIVYNPGPAVRTKAQPTLSAFFQQRLRWAGKWRFNSSVGTRLVAVFILVIQAMFIYGFYRMMRGDLVFVSLILLKLLVEYVALKRFAKFLNIRFHDLSFLLLQLCYPFYVTFVGIVSLFKPYSWKGRKYDR